MVHRVLEHQLHKALTQVLPEVGAEAVQVRPCPDPRFGDYQSTTLMSVAKQRKMNPRQLAADVLAKLDANQWCEKVEIAGPGFLNFRLKTDAVEAELNSAARGEHLFFEKAEKPRTIVVDFSSPNVAKPMHVGHIRSTILGDTLARTLRSLGHKIITDNHIGDWGTQFGKLLVGWNRYLNPDALKENAIDELERLYKKAHAESETNPAVMEEARQELVKLQKGDAENRAIWHKMIDLSQHQFDEIYGRLGVRFDHSFGESFYNPHLPEIVRKLRESGIAEESEGAIVVFFKEDPALKGTPAIIQKRDGGYNYATTDLATLEYRVQTWNPDEIVYVTDGRQQLHFQQVFAIFRPLHPHSRVKLAHGWFGSILGEDGTPLKTREGETVKLADLLNEAEERALKVVAERNPELPEAQRKQVARVVGIAAIKYADLLPNRQSDYVFSWDKMLALEGNTAPYMLYAYARIRSIFRKGGIEAPSASPVCLGANEELTLAKHLLNYGIILEAVSEEYRPNFLCNYLYELAGKFTSFYEACPVLKAEPAIRESRLALADLAARVLKQGLATLGIETLEQM